MGGAAGANQLIRGPALAVPSAIYMSSRLLHKSAPLPFSFFTRHRSFSETLHLLGDNFIYTLKLTYVLLVGAISLVLCGLYYGYIFAVDILIYGLTLELTMYCVAVAGVVISAIYGGMVARYLFDVGRFLIYTAWSLAGNHNGSMAPHYTG